MRYILESGLKYYHLHRPIKGSAMHRSRTAINCPQIALVRVPLGKITCRESLCGLLKYYQRKAA